MNTAADLQRRARAAFLKLTREQVGEAVADMRARELSDYSISAATGLSVEAVRQILAERREARGASR
jgi:hypothetical protein